MRRKISSDEIEMDTPKIIGNRLFKIRYVAGFGRREQQGEYAGLLMIDDKSYSQWETGRVMIPVHHAIRVIEAEFNAGVTLDFIYRGSLDFVTAPLRLPLRDAPDRPETFRGRASAVKSPRPRRR